MKWTKLSLIIEGAIGNSIFFLSIISILSTVPFSGLFLNNRILSLSIVGAIFILTSYLLVKIYSPEEIHVYKNDVEYYNHVKQLNSKGYLDYKLEFSCIEKDKDFVNLIRNKENRFIELDEFSSIDNLKKKIGEKRALLSLSILKFYLMDFYYPIIRKIITFLFIVGVFLFYLGPVLRIYHIIFTSFYHAT